MPHARAEDRTAYKAAYRLANRESIAAYKSDYDAAHRVERSAYNASYASEHKDDRRTRRYQITPDEYAQMLERQFGSCAICRQPETTKRNGRVLALSVDHDHATGERRRLLCGRCNRLLGAVQDNPQLLREAAGYLEENHADTQ